MKRLQAYFTSMCEARNAAAALEQAGCGKAHLDLAGAMDYEYSLELCQLELPRSQSGEPDHLSAMLMGLWSRGLTDSHAVSPLPFGKRPDSNCEEGELKITTRLMLKIQEGSDGDAQRIILENGGRISPGSTV